MASMLWRRSKRNCNTKLL